MWTLKSCIFKNNRDRKRNRQYCLHRLSSQNQDEPPLVQFPKRFNVKIPHFRDYCKVFTIHLSPTSVLMPACQFNLIKTSAQIITAIIVIRNRYSRPQRRLDHSVVLFRDNNDGFFWRRQVAPFGHILARADRVLDVAGARGLGVRLPVQPLHGGRQQGGHLHLGLLERQFYD